MNLKLLAAAQVVFCVAVACGAADAPASARRTIDSLGPSARKWFAASMASMDANWDDRIGIMGGHVRETAFYAVGLLLRNAPGADKDDFRTGRWTLPGLSVEIRTNAPAPTVVAAANSIRATYPVAKKARGETITFEFRLARPKADRQPAANGSMKRRGPTQRPRFPIFPHQPGDK